MTVPSVLKYQRTIAVTIEGQGLAGATVSVGDINCPLKSGSNDTQVIFNFP